MKLASSARLSLTCKAPAPDVADGASLQPKLDPRALTAAACTRRQNSTCLLLNTVKHYRDLSFFVLQSDFNLKPDEALHLDIFQHAQYFAPTHRPLRGGEELQQGPLLCRVRPQGISMLYPC